MIGDEYFPAFVTHNTEQSRTLGAALDNLLGKTCPRAVLANPVTLCAVLIELWRNLPCVELESLLLCLPFYCAINCKQLPELTESGSLPETWQLNEELAQRLSFACDSREFYERVLARFGKEELEETLALCDVIEAESDESIDCFRKLVQSSYKSFH